MVKFKWIVLFVGLLMLASCEAMSNMMGQWTGGVIGASPETQEAAQNVDAAVSGWMDTILPGLGGMIFGAAGENVRSRARVRREAADTARVEAAVKAAKPA